jgi:hypothetical protein
MATVGYLNYDLNNQDSTANIKSIDHFSWTSNKDIIIPKKITIKVNEKEEDYTVTSIGNSAFKESTLKSIKFEPDSSLKTIGESAFEKSKIKSIVIPASVTKIDDSAFELSNLKSIVFEGSKPDFGINVFNKISSTLNPSFGYINKPDSWKGTNYINDLIIRNTSYYSKSIISIIICLIFLFMLYISKISVEYKYSLYIMIIISSLIFNNIFIFNFSNLILLIYLIIMLLPFLLFFMVLIPIYPLLKMLLFGFFVFPYFIFMIVNNFIHTILNTNLIR